MLKGDRTLTLVHRRHNSVPLNAAAKDQMLAHVERLWGHSVVLEEETETETNPA